MKSSTRPFVSPHTDRIVYAVLGALLVGCVLTGLATATYWPAGIPLVFFVVYQAVTDFRPLYYLLLFFLPLSVEVYLPGGVGTDLPTEPIMVGLMGIFLLHAARYWPRYELRYYAHPLALLLYLHLAWILTTTLFSDGLVVSIKFLLAKLWYVAAFFLLSGQIIRGKREVNRIGWIIFWPLLFVALQSFLRHAALGFSFADQYKTLSPFLRNHVAYAGILALFVPWLFLLGRSLPSGSRRRYGMYGVGLFWLVAIYFSYTRAAYVAVMLAAGAYFVFRWKLIRPALLVGTIAGLYVITGLIRDNQYLEYAPNYETTVAHERFDNLIEATYKLEDISTMERAYRWVAGGNMIAYRPWFGWGPGNFVEFYKGYTVSSFTTYVSDNPERSGVHSYFLMTLVEQGWTGLLIFVVLLLAILIFGENIYHRQADPGKRAIIMTVLLSQVIIYAFLLINDMLETDKMGSFFFLNLAILVVMDKR